MPHATRITPHTAYRIPRSAIGHRLQHAAKSAKQKALLYDLKKTIDKIQGQLKGVKAELDALLDVDEPEYMVNRQTRKNALEEELGELPFDCFAVMAGTVGKEVQVATLKAVVRVSMVGEPLPDQDQKLLEAMMKPVEFTVRAYVLAAWNLVPMDSDGASDPYLVLKLGDQKIENRKDHINNVTTAHFYRMFEFKTRLPGDALLKIDVMDFDDFGKLSDDLIGSTTIDLEDRIFSERWKRDLSARPPVEWRNLYSPLSKHPQGEATPHRTASHRAASHHTTTHYTIPHYAIPHHTVPYRTTPHQFPPLRSTPFYPSPFYSTPTIPTPSSHHHTPLHPQPTYPTPLHPSTTTREMLEISLRMPHYPLLTTY